VASVISWAAPEAGLLFKWLMGMKPSNGFGV